MIIPARPLAETERDLAGFFRAARLGWRLRRAMRGATLKPEKSGRGERLARVLAPRLNGTRADRALWMIGLGSDLAADVFEDMLAEKTAEAAS